MEWHRAAGAEIVEADEVDVMEVQCSGWGRSVWVLTERDPPTVNVYLLGFQTQSCHAGELMLYGLEEHLEKERRTGMEVNLVCIGSDGAVLRPYLWPHRYMPYTILSLYRSELIRPESSIGAGLELRQLHSHTSDYASTIAAHWEYSIDGTEAQIQRLLATRAAVACFHDRQLVSWVVQQSNPRILGMFHTVEAYRHQGIGTRVLYQCAKQVLHDIPRVFVLVSPENEASLQACTRIGFRAWIQCSYLTQDTLL